VGIKRRLGADILNSFRSHFFQQAGHALYRADYRDDNANERIAIADPNSIEGEHTQAILSKMDIYGYALIRMDGVEVSPDVLSIVAGKLNLGNPFVPPYYNDFKGQVEVSRGINVIGLSHDNKSRDGTTILRHNAFDTTNEQKLHVDGTVQKIGHIKTSIILCHTKAETGGLSTFFNSTAAFYDVLVSDPDAALAMMDERALSRAVDADKNNPYIGPVFSFQEGQLVSRFSLDGTSDWTKGFQALPSLKRAYDSVVEKIYSGSPYYKELQLEGGDAVIIANMRIAHGRTAYQSYAGRERKMYRALYENYPGA